FREAFVRIERNEFDLGGIVKNRRRNGATKTNVEARPVSLIVRAREAGQADVDAAKNRVSTQGSFQRLRIVALVGNGGRRDCDRNRKTDQEAGSKVQRKKPRHVLSRC